MFFVEKNREIGSFLLEFMEIEKELNVYNGKAGSRKFTDGHRQEENRTGLQTPADRGGL